jgi:hypothetical protein
MMSKFFSILLFMSALTFRISAQGLKSDSLFVPSSVKQFQFNLIKPAERITNLQYENSGVPIKGNLTPDGRRIFLDNYIKGQKVKVTVYYTDGTSEEILKSPCFIDPVRYEL